jgi:prepilin-type N-terminal cleavage/methylation domain-containing protein
MKYYNINPWENINICKKIKGFTLIELIVSLALVFILSGAVAYLFGQGLKSWVSARDRAGIRAESDIAMNRMIKELSQAVEIKKAQEEKVKFKVDLDQDGINEEVEFKLDTNQIKRKEKGAQEIVLASNVRSLVFGYRDYNNNLLTVPVNDKNLREAIRLITITINSAKSDESFALASSVYLRNRH